MNILVLNGSPKGKDSITLQTVLYLVDASLSNSKLKSRMGNAINDGIDKQ